MENTLEPIQGSFLIANNNNPSLNSESNNSSAIFFTSQFK